MIHAVLIENDGYLSHLLFQQQGLSLPVSGSEQETPLLKQTKEQLTAYFNGERQRFTIPLQPDGSPFQLRVWQALTTIPYGKTASYGQIAAAIGKPTAARAVGSANHQNPIAILIPCHRIIGADGSLTGYGGGLPLKQALLDLEQQYYHGTTEL
ncbi:MAG: methylated-DNA--[protein]-cysteine S-methyltransferase [Clostridiales bacterium]